MYTLYNLIDWLNRTQDPGSTRGAGAKNKKNAFKLGTLR